MRPIGAYSFPLSGTERTNFFGHPMWHGTRLKGAGPNRLICHVRAVVYSCQIWVPRVDPRPLGRLNDSVCVNKKVQSLPLWDGAPGRSIEFAKLRSVQQTAYQPRVGAVESSKTAQKRKGYCVSPNWHAWILRTPSER